MVEVPAAGRCWVFWPCWTHEFLRWRSCWVGQVLNDFSKTMTAVQSLEHQKTTHFHGWQCLLERCSFLDSSLWQVNGKLRSESGIHQPPRYVIWMKQTSHQDALEVYYSAATAMLVPQSVTTSKLFYIENSNTLWTSWNRIHLAVSTKNPWSDPLLPKWIKQNHGTTPLKERWLEWERYEILHRDRAMGIFQFTVLFNFWKLKHVCPVCFNFPYLNDST